LERGCYTYILKKKIMKHSIYTVGFLSLMLFGFSAHAQVYKTAEDTVKLNSEFVEVSNDISSLSSRLAIAKNNMSDYRSKVNTADAKAQDAAETSSEQATKATAGGVKEARKAKRQSKKAYREAKDARSATNDVGNQDDKIVFLTGQLAKKQERLAQLTAMRTAIYDLIPKQ
jgi:hypothetical protein